VGSGLAGRRIRTIKLLNLWEGIKMNVIGMEVVGVVVDGVELLVTWMSPDWDSGSSNDWSGSRGNLGGNFAADFGRRV